MAPTSHVHSENLDYRRTLGDYNSNFSSKTRKLVAGSYTRNEDAPKWLRKIITVATNEQGFYTANGSLIRSSIVRRYYTATDGAAPDTNG